MKRVFLFLCAFLFLLPFAAAGEPLHMTLLAVQEDNNTLVGHTADLFLEVQPGKGRIFLETFPLTKLDTQISTRFAKEIACNYFDLRCGQSDFIYTISSDSSIIGGPSAGAALAALTTAGVLGLPVNESVAVTGTINSGGLIGPVGGLKAKIDAAQLAGVTLVLIPVGTRIAKEHDRLDLAGYGTSKNITVVEVSDLNDVVQYFTGRRLIMDNATISTHPEYQSIMKDISDELCERGDELRSQAASFALNASEREDITNRTAKITEAQQAGSYYPLASYCFGLNIKFRSIIYEKQNLSQAKIQSKDEQLRKDIERLEGSVRARELHTITDIQAFSIVVDRLNEAKQFLDRLKEEDDKAFLLSYAEERVFSAQVWMRFFEMSGLQYALNKDVLRRSCVEKVQEAKERLQYVNLFLPAAGISEDIDHAEEQSRAGDYELCLIQASQAKAEANAILSTLGVEEEEMDRLVENKLAALEKLIVRTEKKRAFPILGFSYYEYAQSLKKDEVASALLYAEYALELSNLDIYFEEEAPAPSPIAEEAIVTKERLALVGVGFGVGVVAAVVVFVFVRRSARQEKKGTSAVARRKQRRK